VVPIFIIVKDRLEVLKKTIQSFESSIKTPFEIVIHDNNSTYEPTIDYLKELEKQGKKVYRNKKISKNNVEELHSVRESINKHKSNSKYYVVTDPDIELDNVRGDILVFYAFILNNFKKFQVVGPQLRIDDIPDYYLLKKEVIARHSKLWNKKSLKVNFIYRGENFRAVKYAIDTTFGMYRNGYVFKRLSKGVRTFSPYSARHLDWYIDPNKLTDDALYYINMKDRLRLKMGHWSTEKLIKKAIG